ncbi:MAG: hypothetical protein RLP14_01815 [Owenweeksia sp.]
MFRMAPMASVPAHHKEVRHEKNDQENKERIIAIETENGQQK